MRESPSHPQEPFLHPRIVEMDKTRTVIRVNFAGNRAERDFCAKHGAGTLSEAVTVSDAAAMEFLSTIERFRTNAPDYLSESIVLAILSGRDRVEYFMVHIQRFRPLMSRMHFEDALFNIVKSDAASACYFLSHPEIFKKVGAYKTAKWIAEGCIRRSNKGFIKGNETK